MKQNQALPACEYGGKPLPSQPNPSAHILMVDDDVLIRQVNVEMLSRAGYEVDAAEDGADAWEALTNCNYDLLITDNTMPRLSGVELLKNLHTGRISLPTIMATGTLPQHEFSRYPWLRPAATLTKPYTSEELLLTVKKVLHADVGIWEQTVPQSTNQGPAPSDRL